MTTRIVPGRRLVRTNLRCEGCKARVTIGEPSATDAWASRLRLSVDQVNYLLGAAAEYRDLCAGAGEPQSAVAFVDWLSVDALRRIA